jgi:photosystem II stability/assembly factor-like uncharacterized protein
LVSVLGIDRGSPETLYGISSGLLVKSNDSGRSWFAAARGLLPGAIAIGIDPRTPETLYAVTNGGVFRSLDAGHSWVVVHPVGTGYCATGSARATVVFDPVTPTTVYVGICGGGLFRSTDSGASWVDAGHGFGNSDLSVTSVALDPTTPLTLYVATVFDIYKSNDAGGTWTRVSTAGYTQAVVVDPRNPSTVYATAWPGVVIKSINGGATWATMNNNFPNHDISSLVMDPWEPSTLYLGTRDAGVFKSTVSGEAWVQVTQGLTDLAVATLVIAPAAPRSLYASTSVGSFQSKDAGASWTLLPGPAGVGVLSFATSAATVFVGTFGDGVYRSNDHGGTWTQANTGLTRASPEIGITAEALVIDPATPTTVYAATHAGVFKSTDSGANWVGANRGLEGSGFPFSLAIDPQNPATLYVGNLDGVARSTDGGDHWSFVYVPPQIPPFYGASALVIDPSTPGGLYAIMNGQVLKSANSGATWAAAHTGLPVGSASSLAINPLANATLYAATGDGVFKSTDSGGTWAPVNTGLTDVAVFALVLDPTSPDTLYAGTWQGGVFRSTDGGATWGAFNKGLTSQSVSALAIDPNARTVYAGLRDDGVWAFRGSTGGFHTVAPCRVVDTRLADGPALAAGATRDFTMVGRCGIPPEAGSVSVNVTVTDATSPGHLRICPGHVALLFNSSLNFASGQTRANSAVSLLGAAGDIAVFSGQGNGSVQVIVDVNGYFE